MTNKKTNKTSKASSGKSRKQPKLEELQQTTGKDYESRVSKARELEQIMGIHKSSPFRTTDPKVFESMIEDINLTDLQSMAVKVGIFPSGNKTVLRNKIKRAFKASLIGRGSVNLMGKPLELDPENPQHKEVIDYLRD